MALFDLKGDKMEIIFLKTSGQFQGINVFLYAKKVHCFQ